MITIRHERVVVMTTTYVIGFITAFIAFGIPEPTPQYASVYESVAVENEQISPLSLPDAASPETQPEPVVQDRGESASLYYKDGRLEFSLGGNSVLLSLNPENSTPALDTTGLEQGFHFGELSYKLLAFGSYVFFCESHEVGSEVCSPYLFNVADNKITPFTYNDQALTVDIKDANKVEWSEEGISLGDYLSVSPFEPSQVRQQNDPIDLQVQ